MAAQATLVQDLPLQQFVSRNLSTGVYDKFGRPERTFNMLTRLMLCVRPKSRESSDLALLLILKEKMDMHASANADTIPKPRRRNKFALTDKSMSVTLPMQKDLCHSFAADVGSTAYHNKYVDPRTPTALCIE